MLGIAALLPLVGAGCCARPGAARGARRARWTSWPLGDRIQSREDLAAQ
jgi:hypothetical protein